MSANGVVVKSFKSKNDTNCRTYMKCEPNGGKVAACCRSEYFYNRETMECERVTDLLDICREETCPDGFQEGTSLVQKTVEIKAERRIYYVYKLM